MVEADAGGKWFVFRGDDQREGLGESFEHDLIGRVDRQQPHPRHVLTGADGGVAGALEAVAEDFMQRELAYAYLGEGGGAEVEP